MLQNRTFISFKKKNMYNVYIFIICIVYNIHLEKANRILPFLVIGLMLTKEKVFAIIRFIYTTVMDSFSNSNPRNSKISTIRTNPKSPEM